MGAVLGVVGCQLGWRLLAGDGAWGIGSGGPETLPGPDRPAQIAALFWMVLAAAGVALWLAWRAGDRRLPQMLRRPTPNHLSFVGVLILPVAAVVVSERYYLTPDHEPASYHLQMNPGLANRLGGRLAEDVASADWLILTSLFDGWDEPNRSVQDGDLRADAVVESSFCAVETIGKSTLYRRCPGEAAQG